MSHILILVSGDENNCLSENHFAIAQKKIEIPLHFKWLHPQKAAECPIDVTADNLCFMELKNIFEAEKIDTFIVPAHNRKKKLLLADMDATIVKDETLDELAASVGLKSEIATITLRAMRGELDFKAALIERVKMLKDTPLSALQDTLARMEINRGALETVRVMRQHGAECYLVSGGFTYFTKIISEKCGFNGHHGNQLAFADNRMTGEVILPILDKDAKLTLLNHYTQLLHLNAADTLAVGDGANDIPMLQNAGLGVGYHPKPLVVDSIQNCILHTDLTSLLYIQGYSWQNITA